MTREQAIEVLISRYNSGVIRSRTNDDEWRLATDTVIAALRGPEPDPDTGLVPCGCGGSAGAWEQQTSKGVKRYVECGTCEISTADYDTPRDAITAWNTALGWGGGQEHDADR